MNECFDAWVGWLVGRLQMQSSGASAVNPRAAHSHRDEGEASLQAWLE